jgi:hypothetical protein
MFNYSHKIIFISIFQKVSLIILKNFIRIYRNFSLTPSEVVAGGGAGGHSSSSAISLFCFSRLSSVLLLPLVVLVTLMDVEVGSLTAD